MKEVWFGQDEESRQRNRRSLAFKLVHYFSLKKRSKSVRKYAKLMKLVTLDSITGYHLLWCVQVETIYINPLCLATGFQWVGYSMELDSSEAMGAAPWNLFGLFAFEAV